MLPTILVFPGERAIFLKEESSKSYKVRNYFFAKIMIEIPLLCGFTVLFDLILYYMVGLNSSRFPYFLLITILSSFNGSMMGYMIGAAFS